MTKNEIITKLKMLFKEDAVEVWLDAPNPAFDNEKPRKLIESGDCEKIERMIYQLESGVAS